MWKLIAQSLLHRPVTMKGPEALALSLDLKARQKLGRSLAIRQVDAGSCNGCELEIHALNNPYYDLERFGLKFVASPRHADVLLVTGPVTRNMAEALGLKDLYVGQGGRGDFHSLVLGRRGAAYWPAASRKSTDCRPGIADLPPRAAAGRWLSPVAPEGQAGPGAGRPDRAGSRECEGRPE